MCKCNFPKLCGKKYFCLDYIFELFCENQQMLQQCINQGGIQEQENPTRMSVCGLPGLKGTYVNTRRNVHMEALSQK